MPNLSLLSRGAGQVVWKEKLEVHFEPEDYLNWKSPERRCYVTRSLDHSEVVEGSGGLDLPKTYSTKTGPLILYSEDLAKPSRKPSKPQQRFRSKSRTLHIELHTLQDLVRAILAYGGKQARKDRKEAAWQPYLHFQSDPPIRPDRQMRPGYSAKRYLLKLLKFAKIWDPNILQKLQRAGYLKDPFVLEENVPYCRRKQDLSAIPPKYKLLPVFCSPSSYLWDQMEKASAGLGLSSYMKSGNEPWLAEGYKREKHARRRPQNPFRASIRKLSFLLSPQRSKESTWRQKAKYGATAEHPDVQGHQNREPTKEGQSQTETANQSTDCPALGKILTDTSELWREKSHLTFYGGFFRGRKLADIVNQRQPKNPSDREGRPSGLLPTIQPGTSSEQSELRKPQRKLMPEIFRLPVIAEEHLRAHRERLKSRELPKELVIFPLLVQLERETHIKRKSRRAAGCDESCSGAYVCNKPLVPLSNDRFPGPEHRNKTLQVVSSENPETPECSFYLPPIRNGELAVSRTKTRTRERGAEMDSQHQRESIPDGAPTLGPLPAITRTKDPSDGDKRANSGTSTGTASGVQGVCKDLPVGTTNSAQQEKLGECYSGASLSSLPRGPGGEMVCPLPSGSIQAPGEAEFFGFVQDEEADSTESLAAKMGANRNQPQTPFSAPELDEKVTPKIQEVGRVPETKNSLPKEQSNTGRGSRGADLREDIPRSQDCFGGNNLPRQRKPEKGLPGLPKTQVPKQKEAQVTTERWQERRSRGKARLNSMPEAKSSRDTGKQAETLPQSDSFSRFEPSLSQWMIPESEMDPDSAILEFPVLSKERSVEMEMGLHSSERQAEAGKNGDATLPEKASLQTKITGRISAADGSENKLITRKKKPELGKAGPGSKAQQKSVKKDKRQSRAEFVVGKPKQTKAIRETSPFSKEKTGDVINPGMPEKEEKQREAEADEEQIVSDAEEDTLGWSSDKSTSPSLYPTEEGLLSPEDGQPFLADIEHLSGSHTDGLHKTPASTPPAVYTAVGSQNNGVPSGELPTVLPETKGEEKLSRERIIAERAEKRRLAVERKRWEQEEQKRKQQEEQERMESMKEEMEEEKRRRIEEIRLRKQQLQEECQRQEEEAARKLQAEKAAQERFRQQQEELRKKLLEAQKKKEEEERDRAEAEKRRQKERETWLEEERQRLAEMAEEQRVEYEKQKHEEEERARREAEERRKKEEAAARAALEEARKQALLLARQRAEQEEKHQFQHTLLVEASGLEQRQEISRPWVYSYFQHPFLKVGDEDC